MSPLDRISQLSAGLSKLRDENMILRSQLADARGQAKRDSATIQALMNHKQAFAVVLEDCAFILSKLGNNWREAGAMTDSCKRAAFDAKEILAQYPAT